MNPTTPNRRSQPGKRNPYFGNPERIRLQAMTVTELVAEAHARHKMVPRLFPTPQHAWHHLRFWIEPDSWDVQREYLDSGTVEVAIFGGEAVITLPAGPTSYDDAWQKLQDWFNETYPKHLHLVASEDVGAFAVEGSAC